MCKNRNMTQLCAYIITSFGESIPLCSNLGDRPAIYLRKSDKVVDTRTDMRWVLVPSFVSRTLLKAALAGRKDVKKMTKKTGMILEDSGISRRLGLSCSCLPSRYKWVVSTNVCSRTDDNHVVVLHCILTPPRVTQRIPSQQHACVFKFTQNRVQLFPQNVGWR
jgi:hypothetical protein